ncbi:MAG: hypothetical protein ACI9IL_001179 [Rickettsiales bacterium]|jgi:hypothetical protein
MEINEITRYDALNTKLFNKINIRAALSDNLSIKDCRQYHDDDNFQVINSLGLNKGCLEKSSSHWIKTSNQLTTS